MLKKIKEWMFKDVIKRLEDRVFETINCETCGCMVRKDIAIKGKAELKEKFNIGIAGYFETYTYMYTPYFCKRCAKEKAIVGADIIKIRTPEKYKI